MSEDPDRPGWATIARTPAYSGRVRIVAHEVQYPSGAHDVFEVDETVPFAAAVLVYEDGAALLAEQYRYPIDRWILDLPGGAAEPGETPEQTARRECEEELGLIPVQMTAIDTFFPNPGRAAWPAHLFFAGSTRPGRPRDDDESERVRLARLPLHELDERIRLGSIVDPALIIARALTAARGLLPPLG